MIGFTPLFPIHLIPTLKRPSLPIHAAGPPLDVASSGGGGSEEERTTAPEPQFADGVPEPNLSYPFAPSRASPKSGASARATAEHALARASDNEKVTDIDEELAERHQKLSGRPEMHLVRV